MKKTIDTNYTFKNETHSGLTLALLADMMSRHVTACGVTVSAGECAHVISAMASNRLLYIESNSDADGSITLANAIASFLGTGGKETVCTAETEALSFLMSGKGVGGPLADKLGAIIGTGKLGAVVIDNRAGADISNVLSGLEGYFSDENEACSVSYNGQSLVLPKNTYFIIVMPAGKGRELIGTELSYFACPIICERLVTLVTNEEEMAPTPIGAEDFSELCREAYFRYQPSEEDWRRIDRIDAFLESRLGHGFGNDGYLKMEKYFSVFTACKGDFSVAIDALLCDYVKSRSAELTHNDAAELCSLLSSMSNDLKLPKTVIAAGSISH